MQGHCDFCEKEHGYINPIYDFFESHVLNICAFGCGDPRNEVIQLDRNLNLAQCSVCHRVLKPEKTFHYNKYHFFCSDDCIDEMKEKYLLTINYRNFYFSPVHEVKMTEDMGESLKLKVINGRLFSVEDAKIEVMSLK